MTNSEMFKKAHNVASRTVVIVGDYRIAFSIALKVLIKTAKFTKQMTEYAKEIQMKASLYGGCNAYVSLVRILNDTEKLNQPKKKRSTGQNLTIAKAVATNLK